MARCAGLLYLLVNQVLGAGDEVVEDILFVGEVSGLMPLFAILASAAQIGDDIYAALVEPEARAGPYEVGLFVDAVAAVAVKQRWIGAIELGSFAADDVHRHACAVF